MDITSLAISPSAMTATQGSSAQAAQLLMLRKAMDMQASSASALIQTLPQPAALASSASLGRNVNTYA